MGLNEGTDAISGILNRPEEPEIETEVEAKEVEPVEDTPAEESVEAKEPEPKEAKEKPAKEEDDATSEIELEPSQVAQMLGLDEGDIDVDDDGAIQVHAKIDGKPAKVPLQDLRRSYELAQTHEERLRELGRERKAFEDQSKSVLESLVNQQQQFAQSVQMLEEDFANDFQSVDWTSLREDPTEYLTKKQDYEDRRRRIEEHKTKLSLQSQELQQQYAQKLQEQQAEGVKQLEEVFQGPAYASAPKWDQAERDRLSKWIMDQGFSAQDISSVGVWRVFKWARDSMLRESELQKAKEAVKKVAKLPKIVKPGKSKSQREIKKSQTKGLKERQVKSGGGLRETTDLIGSLLDRGS
jgi:hypothetical protein